MINYFLLFYYFIQFMILYLYYTVFTYEIKEKEVSEEIINKYKDL